MRFDVGLKDCTTFVVGEPGGGWRLGEAPAAMRGQERTGGGGTIAIESRTNPLLSDGISEYWYPCIACTYSGRLRQKKRRNNT